MKTINLTKFHIKITILIARLIGWMQIGDIKQDRKKDELLKAKILTNYFTQKYLPAIKDLPQREIAAETSETIWQFWDNPKGQETPEIVKASIESVKRFRGNFEHKILDNSTIENYSDLPGYVLDKFKKKQIDYAHFSDLLRLNLLKNHGGIWMDATDYMTDLVPKYILDEDFFVFLTCETSLFHYAFMQNCFIRAKIGSFLCEGWYQMCIEYWKNETRKIDYFQHQLMFKSLILNNQTAKKLFAEMPHCSENETHQLVRKLLQKFDENEWERIKKTSFFQKTTYRAAIGTDYSGTYLSRLSEGAL